MIRKINNVFVLTNENISYVFAVKGNGMLQHIYFGEKIDFDELDGVLQAMPIYGKSLEWYEEDSRETPFINSLSVEFAGQQMGDTKTSNIQIEMDDANTKYDFRYVDYDLVNGDSQLLDFPETRKYDCCSLRVKMIDSIHNICIYLHYTIFEGQNCIVRKTEICNNNPKEIVVDHLVSMNLDFPCNLTNTLTLQGGLNRECDCIKQKLNLGTFSISSSIGHSSATANPFMALSEEEFTDSYGRIYSTMFMYSGNYEINLENTGFDISRLTTSINRNTNRIRLGTQETYATPETLIFYSDGGLNQMRINHHDFITKHVLNPQIVNTHNMLTVNSWEAMVFDISTERLLPLIDQAAEIGAELFVIDDGWFQGRNDDTTSLGDWFVDQVKFPGTDFKYLSNYVKQKGMKFGLWFEPEMINMQSKLYNAHPEWVLGSNSPDLCTGRNQYVLDMGNDQVVEALYIMIDQMISEYQIDYLKWDMNRNIAECNSPIVVNKEQGAVAYNYMRGVYRLLHKVLSKYPELVIEGCASGGNRFDLGMLYYMPQIWVSDNTDAIRRIRIQYGLALVYPLATLDNAVTKEVSYMGRSIPLCTRMNVASFGNFGYNYNLLDSSSSELEHESVFNEFYKKIKPLIITGDVYMDSFDSVSQHTHWSVVAKDKSKVYSVVFRLNRELNQSLKYIKFKGLKSKAIYRFNDDERYYGSYLMNIGLPIQSLAADCEFFNSFTYYLEEVAK